MTARCVAVGRLPAEGIGAATSGYSIALGALGVARSPTISIAIDDSTRHELVRLSDPDELGIAFADDEAMQPHIALSAAGARSSGCAPRAAAATSTPSARWSRT